MIEPERDEGIVANLAATFLNPADCCLTLRVRSVVPVQLLGSDWWIRGENRIE